MLKDINVNQHVVMISQLLSNSLSFHGLRAIGIIILFCDGSFANDLTAPTLVVTAFCFKNSIDFTLLTRQDTHFALNHAEHRTTWDDDLQEL